MQGMEVDRSLYTRWGRCSGNSFPEEAASTAEASRRAASGQTKSSEVAGHPLAPEKPHET